MSPRRGNLLEAPPAEARGTTWTFFDGAQMPLVAPLLLPNSPSLVLGASLMIWKLDETSRMMMAGAIYQTWQTLLAGPGSFWDL